MAATWIIQEMQPDGRGGYVAHPAGERFTWLSGSVPNPEGGARAAPLKSITTPMAVRSVRTDYPGSKVPSEQVLGYHFEPFELHGKWYDKYNFAGYALRELGRFEAMVSRANMVRIHFGVHVFDCLITNFVPDVSRDWEIRYSFTVSNHGRAGALPGATGELSRVGAEAARGNPRQSVPQAFDELAIETEYINRAVGEMRAGALNSTVFGDLADKVEQLNVTLNGFADTMDQRVLRPISRPIQEFKKLATQCRMMQGNCADIILRTASLRSDTELAVNGAMEVLDFEAWTRTMRFNTRLLMGKAGRSAKAMDERDEPSAVAIYEPYAGESLYGISRRFYGTPHAWRPIADRNALSKFTMTGDEQLIIPERGAG